MYKSKFAYLYTSETFYKHSYCPIYSLLLLTFSKPLERKFLEFYQEISS